MIEERTKAVYEWSSKQTAESKEFTLEDYYWTEPARRALFRLQNNKAVLLGIVGLQGSGKSTVIRAIRESLDQLSVFYKWSRDWRKAWIKDEAPMENYYFETLWTRLVDDKPDVVRNKLSVATYVIKNLIDIVSDYPHQMKQAKTSEEREKLIDRNYRAMDSLDRIATPETVERLLGDKIVQSIGEEFLNDFVANTDCFFIDMPDYTKNDVRTMSKDVDELQHLWDEFASKGRKTSFVIAMQKEIVMRRPHFFFGKISMIELKPFTAEQLVEAYRQKWTTAEPFAEDALMLIAKLSRGIFRRFLKYIHLTIENSLIEEKACPITVEDVEKAVSFDVLLGDMELEFADIFTQQAHKVQATKMLQTLREETLSQKQIAERLNMTESMVTKIVGKLELYGYVKRTRGEGTTWLVSLA